MDNVEEYLSQFEDFELAFFWRYKLDTYMEETQKEIMDYLKKRSLDEAKMKVLIEEYSQKSFPDHELRCPRCKSKKLVVHKGKSFSFSSLNTTKYIEELICYKDINSGTASFTCRVCDFYFST